MVLCVECRLFVFAVAMSLWTRVDNGSRFADLDLPCVLVSRALLTVCHSSISWCLKRLWVSRAACTEGKGVGTTLRSLWLTCGGVVSASLGWGLLSCPACSPWLKHAGPACPLVTAPPPLYLFLYKSYLPPPLLAPSLSLSIYSLSLSRPSPLPLSHAPSSCALFLSARQGCLVPCNGIKFSSAWANLPLAPGFDCIYI